MLASIIVLYSIWCSPISTRSVQEVEDGRTPPHKHCRICFCFNYQLYLWYQLGNKQLLFAYLASFCNRSIQEGQKIEHLSIQTFIFSTNCYFGFGFSEIPRQNTKDYLNCLCFLAATLLFLLSGFHNLLEIWARHTGELLELLCLISVVYRNGSLCLYDFMA